MGLITVDQDKCTRDGICVEICPLSLLILDPNCGPKLLPGAGHHCIGCGQCVAACPSGALDNRKNPIAGQLPILRASRLIPTLRQSSCAPVARSGATRTNPYPGTGCSSCSISPGLRPSGHNSQGISYLVVEAARTCPSSGNL